MRHAAQVKSSSLGPRSSVPGRTGGHRVSRAAPARQICALPLPVLSRPLVRLSAAPSVPRSYFHLLKPGYRRSFYTDSTVQAESTADSSASNDSAKPRERSAPLPLEWKEFLRVANGFRDGPEVIQQFDAAQQAIGIPPAQVYKELGRRVFKLDGGLEAMLALHKQMQEYSIDAPGVSWWLMMAYFESRRPKEVIKIFNEARKYATLDSQAYELIMHIHSKNNDKTAADELFAEMKNSSVQLTERFYSSYLPLFANDREKFYALRAEARSLGFRLSSIWDQLIAILLRFGDYQLAFETYMSLRSEARRFEINPFDRLVQTLRREGNADPIVELYKLEQELGTQIRPAQMVDVVWALGQRGDYHGAIAAFESCWKAAKEKDAAAFLPRNSRSIDVVLFRQVLDLCVRRRDIENSLRFYEMAMQEGFHPKEFSPTFFQQLLGHTPTDEELECVLTRIINAADRADQVGFRPEAAVHESAGTLHTDVSE